MMQDQSQTILLTGATGYIGGRLLKLLEKGNDRIICLARHPENLQGQADSRTEIIQGDVLDKEALVKALRGVDVAYYLVHSMGGENFTQQDRRAASNFAEAAQECGVKRLIYLGGLGERGRPLSSHLKSRQEVGDILRKHAPHVQVIEFRASIVIGSGSLSFELIRTLSERLPIMITPRWIWTLAQPIAISDVLTYLQKAKDIALEGNPILEIGGKDKVSYAGIMLEYCRQRNLKRWVIPVPVLTPYLSSLWLEFVTPLYTRVGKRLIESAVCQTTVEDPSAEKLFGTKPLGVADAIAQALSQEDQQFIETHWSDALSSGGEQQNWAGIRFGNRLIDAKKVSVSVPPDEAFAPIRKIGGKTGWYYGNFLWHMRGFIDLLIGGVGLRRGRRNADQLRVGDFLDFWRVEAYEPNKRLLLQAEMKVPGRAWLEFKVEPTSHGSLIHQNAIFDPVGLGGLLYWYLLYPIHHFVFNGMIKGIAKAAESYPKKRGSS